MASAVFYVGSFGQKEVFPGVRYRKDERLLRWRQEDTLLHLTQFEIEDASQFRFAERFKNDDLVDAVHELGRKLPACRFDSAPTHFLGQLFIHCTGGIALAGF